jgi:predicted nucleic acid-binding protein
MSTSTDRHYRQAVLELARLQQQGAVQFVIHEGIRIELLDTLSSRSARAGAMRLLNSLAAAEAKGELLVIPLERELIERGIRRFDGRPDKEWGLTDCISFVVMQDLEIYEAFTCDHHFEQAGFIRLLPALD